MMQDNLIENIVTTKKITTREHEILNHIVYGKSNQEIADALAISIKTVEWHRLNLMKKMGAHKTADLVRYAFTHHMVEDIGGF